MKGILRRAVFISGFGCTLVTTCAQGIVAVVALQPHGQVLLAASC